MTTLRQVYSRRSMDTRSVLNILMILIAMMVFAAVFSKGVFLQPKNMVNLVLQNAGLIVITLGQMLVIVTMGIDLSVGAVMAVSSVLVVLF